MNKISELQEIIDNSDNIVFFGGAGVSTESGIPDFRSEKGVFLRFVKGTVYCHSKQPWHYPQTPTRPYGDH